MTTVMQATRPRVRQPVCHVLNTVTRLPICGEDRDQPGPPHGEQVCRREAHRGCPVCALVLLFRSQA